MGHNKVGSGAKQFEGRPTVHEQKKQNHNVSITPDGWAGLREQARLNGCSSVSELLENVGREKLLLQSKQERNLLSAASLSEPQATKDIQQELGKIADLLDEAFPGAFEALFGRYIHKALCKALLGQDLVNKTMLEEHGQKAIAPDGIDL